MGKTDFSKSAINNRNSMMNMVASWACEVTEILTQRSLFWARISDLTSPTSNKIPAVHIAVSVVYDSLKILFPHACSSCLIIHFKCEM